MRIIVCGTRTFADYALLCQVLDKLTHKMTEVTVISGAAPGADALGERWARENGHPCERYSAEWDKYGKKAGPLRNQKMIDAGADGLVAFHVADSPGTADIITRARRAQVKVKVIQLSGGGRE